MTILRSQDVRFTRHREDVQLGILTGEYIQLANVKEEDIQLTVLGRKVVILRKYYWEGYSIENN